MPSRWWLPLTGARPDYARLEHLHAALSRWFDPSPEAHVAPTKAFSISPLARDDGEVGCEVAVLTSAALDRFRLHARSAATIRLGADIVRVGRPRRVAEESWEHLTTPSGSRSWVLEFVTPVTFRHGNRSSPLPVPGTLLRGLLTSWNACSELPARELSRRDSDAVWVSDLSGQSALLKLAGLTLSAFSGRVSYRCDDPAIADRIDGLFRLAPYAGCGSGRAKGLGVTRLTLGDRGRIRAVG